MNRKRTWILTGIVTLCLVAVLSLPASAAHAIKMAVTQFFSPMLSAATHARQATLKKLGQTNRRNELVRQNQELAGQVEALRERLRNLEELERENSRFRQLLTFAARTPWRLQAAHVIGRDASNWWKTVLLDRGSNQGIRENMAVLDPAGLVGKTIEVGPHVSRVLLITDPNCKVATLLQQTREPAIVEGIAASSEASLQCQMNFIARGANVKRGDWAIASGLGGVFPKGAVVGQVESVGATGLYQTARIKPSANLTGLEEVFVWLGE